MKKSSVVAAFLAAGLLSSLGFSALAQGNNRVSPGQINRQNMPANPNSNRPISALDQQFVINAVQGSIAKVRFGQLALQKSTNPQVRDFSQRMIQEHTIAYQELMRLTSQKGFIPSTNLGKYQATFERLQQLSGAAFDRAYLNEAGVNIHQESAAIYQRQTQLGQDADLTAFARTILPAVQGHLEMAALMTNYQLEARNSETRSPLPDQSLQDYSWQNNPIPSQNQRQNQFNNSFRNQDSMEMMR